MKLKALIVDDEEGARASLHNILTQYFPEVEVVGQAASAKEGVTAINKGHPEVVFLDIEMPQGNAFDLLKHYDKVDFEVVFITAYDHYAIRAIKYSALDYLLKPIDIDELQAAIEKVKNKKENSVQYRKKLDVLLENVLGQQQPEKIAIADNEGLSFIPLQQIIRIQSDGNYTTFYLTDGKKVVASKSLGEYEALITDSRFFRVHRSHIINIIHVERYVKGEGGYVILSDGSEVEVSRRKKGAFLETLKGNQ